MMTCKDCQARLVAYINGELPPHLRRQVAYHLDACPVCYRLYTRQRDLAGDLQRAVSLLAHREPPRLDRVWASIQADMSRPRRVNAFSPARYGLAALVFLLACLSPWVLGGQDATLAAPPTQPAPLALTVAQTLGGPGPGAVGTVVALAPDESRPTPAARLRQPPLPDATAAPFDEGL